MQIDFTDKQLALLKDILKEYAEESYHSMFEFQHAAIDAADELIQKEYAAMAQAEEAHFNEVKDLQDYIERYEALMRGRS